LPLILFAFLMKFVLGLRELTLYYQTLFELYQSLGLDRITADSISHLPRGDFLEFNIGQNRVSSGGVCVAV
jgi:hypothetical protein